MSTKHEKFHPNGRKNFCTSRVAKLWNCCPGRAGASPCLETSQTHLGAFPCHLRCPTPQGSPGNEGCDGAKLTEGFCRGTITKAGERHECWWEERWGWLGCPEMRRCH